MNLHYTLLIAITILTIVILLSGCSVVKTSYENKSLNEGMLYYYLPQSTVKVNCNTKVALIYDTSTKTLTASNRILEQKYVVTTEQIADTDELLTIQYKQNAFAKDDVKFVVNGKGLLESANITTEDRTAEIIKQIAEAPVKILGLPTTPASRSNTKVIIKEFSADFEIRVSDIMNTQKEIKWIITATTNEDETFQYAQIDASFKLKLNTSNLPQNTDIKSLSSKDKVLDGLLTRPIKNSLLQIESDKITGAAISTNYPVTFIDKSKLVRIPIKRVAFGKRENNITIQDGLITNNQVINPSSVEGFISIPVDVAKAIVSVPAQLVQFKFDNTTNQLKLLEEELKLEQQKLDQEKFAETRQNELDKVLEQIKTDKLNRANQEKVLEFELNTKILEAEKNQLDMQKQIEDLKKQIEELKNNGNGQ